MCQSPCVLLPTPNDGHSTGQGVSSSRSPSFRISTSGDVRKQRSITGDDVAKPLRSRHDSRRDRWAAPACVQCREQMIVIYDGIDDLRSNGAALGLQVVAVLAVPERDRDGDELLLPSILSREHQAIRDLRIAWTSMFAEADALFDRAETRKQVEDAAGITVPAYLIDHLLHHGNARRAFIREYPRGPWTKFDVAKARLVLATDLRYIWRLGEYANIHCPAEEHERVGFKGTAHNRTLSALRRATV
ncbi:hypothetical protein DOTSEDRAFT_30144 [Dothistroma septosporum NZE10]|uniref:Uncharacterized protein n=1 Tax=Dothistroma septosporum (strain NZE10 / CBS 128990) TaxID=675120 RepID=N1Q294_DOTSN|nr:hypothetical protein DOTSEDRAFT_30144 [Dothistroma septosporum NZE10]